MNKAAVFQKIFWENFSIDTLHVSGGLPKEYGIVAAYVAPKNKDIIKGFLLCHGLLSDLLFVSESEVLGGLYKRYFSDLIVDTSNHLDSHPRFTAKFRGLRPYSQTTQMEEYYSNV